MKTLTKIYLVLLIGIISCNESDNELQSIVDEWTYIQDDSQTISFIDSSNALVNDHEFAYTLEGDSIQFIYNGPLFVAIIPSKHKYQLLTNRLTIENLNTLQFFQGETGENVLTSN